MEMFIKLCMKKASEYCVDPIPRNEQIISRRPLCNDFSGIPPLAKRFMLGLFQSHEVDDLLELWDILTFWPMYALNFHV